MNTTDLDRIFNTVGNVGGAVQDVSNLMQNRFGDNNGASFDSRRNYNYGNQNQQQFVSYGYGYADNSQQPMMMNGMFNPVNQGMVNGYPGFYNPAYGGGMMR